MSVSEADQKSLKKLIERRHPKYKETVDHWDFLEQCYRGGRAWFSEDNIFRYLKEGDTEYSDRVDRAYRFNHSREVVDLVNKYIFKAPVERNEEDAPAHVKRFWKKATRNGLGIDEFMRQVSGRSSIFGRIWVVVDSTLKGAAPLTVKDERQVEARTYAYIVTPQHMLDMSYDEFGELNWALVHELARDDEDPLTSSGGMVERFRLWTRQTWHLIELSKDGADVKANVVEEGQHDLGVVPVFAVDNIETDDPYTAPALIGDIAYLDRAVANYLSNLDAIIQDQTFSQLAMPAQGLLPGDEGYDKVKEMGTTRVFLYDGEGGAKPMYLSPDPKQAEIIVKVIKTIINEIYHSVGMAGERTKQDNAVGIDNSSGVAKAYDFERVNALLAAKADSLDRAEEKMVRLVELWNGKDVGDTRSDLVKYSDSFDVRGLTEEFDVANRLVLVDAPRTVRREHMVGLIDKLFPRLSKAAQEQVNAEMKNWPEESLSLVTNPSGNKFAQSLDGDTTQESA